MLIWLGVFSFLRGGVGFRKQANQSVLQISQTKM